MYYFVHNSPRQWQVYTLKESWEDSKIAWNVPAPLFVCVRTLSVSGVGNTKGKDTKVTMSLVCVLTQGGHKQIRVLRVEIVVWLAKEAGLLGSRGSADR